MANDSPFDWRARPSLLAKDPDINGINDRRSQQASRLKKTFFAIGNTDPRTPFNQVNAYGRAVISKTKESLGLP